MPACWLLGRPTSTYVMSRSLRLLFAVVAVALCGEDAMSLEVTPAPQEAEAEPSPQQRPEPDEGLSQRWERLSAMMSKRGIDEPHELLPEVAALRQGSGSRKKQPRIARQLLELLVGAAGHPKVPRLNVTAASRQLGQMYLHGEGMSQDAAAAVRHFEVAAQAGDPESQLALGIVYSTGFGVPRNAPLAATYLHFAAEGGAVGAQLALGYRHLMGVSAPKACYKSLLYYRPVAERVVAAAQKLKGGGVIEKIRLTADNPRGVIKRGADDDVLQYYEVSGEAGGGRERSLWSTGRRTGGALAASATRSESRAHLQAYACLPRPCTRRARLQPRQLSIGARVLRIADGG